ncbi:MAG: hypothetical protein M0Z41_07670 [Peptococcaceae bacterium]|nr:hypothetical protein [Peptococcaceae bacterium]
MPLPFTATPVAAANPKLTAVAPVRLMPVMVTGVDPATGPLLAVMAVGLC